MIAYICIIKLKQFKNIKMSTTTLRDAWTAEEDAKMQKLFNDGVPVAVIAKKMGRTYNSVASRRKRISNFYTFRKLCSIQKTIN
jgi:hypothetical protein